MPETLPNPYCNANLIGVKYLLCAASAAVLADNELQRSRDTGERPSVFRGAVLPAFAVYLATIYREDLQLIEHLGLSKE